MVTTPPGSDAAPAFIEIVVPARNEARRLPAGLAALCQKAATLPLRESSRRKAWRQALHCSGRSAAGQVMPGGVHRQGRQAAFAQPGTHQ